MNHCGNCKLWVQASVLKGAQRGTGHCHAHPPQGVLVPAQNGVGIQFPWPLTAENDWCGDFKARLQVDGNFIIEKGLPGANN